MGGSSSSPRGLSVENPEPPRPHQGGAGVEVSEAALKRAVAAAAPLYQEEPARAAPQPPPVLDRPKYDYSKEEEYWSKRIEALKRAHHAMNKTMHEEYDKAVAETAQMFQRTQTSSIVGKMPPCQQEKALVLKCYAENPTQTLLCTQLVNGFNDCVAQKRTQSTATGA